MRVFDVNQPSELIFYSGIGGLQTLLLAVIGDSSTYYYVDSLSLELLEMTDSVLYSNDFSSSSEGWRSKFADSLELTAGRIDWQSAEENMRIWPWSSDMGTIGAVVREIDVEPGIYNMVMAKVSLPDHPHGKVSLGVYDELAANVDFNTLSIEPLGYAEAEEFEETILYFTFLPNTDKMSLVLMYQSEQYGRVLLDDVQVSSIDPFERDTLQSFTFNDTSSVYNEWRSSIWPDSLIANDSILLSYISHDTLLGRMRIEMVEDFNEPDEILGAVYRRMTGLEVGKKYEASFEIQTDGAHQLKQVNSVVFRNSEFSLGNINPEDSNMINIDSLDIGIDSIVLRFTATESDMVISISANARIAAPYHYYIDNFNLREGWVPTMNCDKSNLQYADGDGRYRFGFNGAEKIDEISGAGNHMDFGARGYDPRRGQWFSVDPQDDRYVGISSYAFCANTPIQAFDPNGEEIYFIIETGGVHPDLAKTRKENLENSKTFDSNKDIVLLMTVTDLGKLKEVVESNVKMHSPKYGKTVEASFFGHASSEGPVGGEDVSLNSLADITRRRGLDGDQKQLSPTGWKSINFNFDTKNSTAIFFGCKSDGFAQRFLGYSNVAQTIGTSGGTGPSYTFEGEIDRVFLMYLIDLYIK